MGGGKKNSCLKKYYKGGEKDGEGEGERERERGGEVEREREIKRGRTFSNQFLGWRAYVHYMV